MFNVTKKINHDSMWIKVSASKSWTKMSLNRSGLNIKFKCAESERDTFKAIADTMGKEFSTIDKNKTYGERFEMLESILANKYSDVK